VILTEDEMSLYLQATTAAVWAPQGETPVVASDPSRTKVHFYGTLNLDSGEELVLRATEMKAATTALHLDQLLKHYPDRPILLLWDRAPWHRGKPIQHVLEANPRLEILYYPVAAPELNPQEHVWKATRQSVSHNHNRPRLGSLADEFEAHLTGQHFESAFLACYGYTAIRTRFI
jgi:transposase